MSQIRKNDSTERRLTRRGFVAGMLLVSATAAIACGGSTAAPAGGAAPAGPTAVKMTDANKFDPAAITISKGATVTWTNGSTMVHSVTDDPAKAAVKADAQLPDGATAWDSGLLQPNATYSHTFDVAGTYKYFCVPHEALGMLGTITVQ
ncbi:MAG TPA: plastocyanin/azurin family copper-binding protein [Chloroflexota bacterium]|nr:plastocyanin/azurin family copper-binding protein [Chloroflexota bacterium]